MKQFKVQQQITIRNEKSIEKYFVEVNRQKTISPEEEISLAKRVREGDELAKEKLIKANLRFVISVAKKYQNNGIDLSDLINEGNIGLIKAAEMFDDTKGFKFISYAVWWIRQALIQSISENKRMVKIPSNKNLEVGKYNRAISQLTQELERYPTDLEIADFMGIKEEDVQVLDCIDMKVASLDKKVGDEDESSTLEDFMVNDTFSDPDDSLIHDSLNEDIDRAFQILSKREAYILKSLYGIGCKQKMKETIAVEYDYTPERIRQISKEAIEKIKVNDKARKLLIKYMS
jgi:RNA polymerase primary sigma factor